MGDVGVIYSKIAGEAWDLGAGYVVGRAAAVATTPMAFIQLSDEKDKKSIPWIIVGAIFLACATLGIVMSIFEHSRPLHTLRVEAQRMAKGEVDMLQVSKFRGVYRKIASDLNDGTDKVAAKGGAPRKAADLESVLGPIPAQPSMSAFSFPMEGGGGAAPAIMGVPGGPSSPGNRPSKPGIQPPAPRPAMAQAIPQQPSQPAAVVQPPAPKPQMPAPKPQMPAPRQEPAAVAPLPPDDDGDEDATVVQQVPHEVMSQATGPSPVGRESDEMADWHAVYEDFVKTKKQCGEPTAGLTFEKFQQTLKKNRDQLISKTQCKRVKFSVYVKDGRAALKASPVRN